MRSTFFVQVANISCVKYFWANNWGRFGYSLLGHLVGSVSCNHVYNWLIHPSVSMWACKTSSKMIFIWMLTNYRAHAEQGCTSAFACTKYSSFGFYSEKDNIPTRSRQLTNTASDFNSFSNLLDGLVLRYPCLSKNLLKSCFFFWPDMLPFPLGVHLYPSLANCWLGNT